MEKGVELFNFDWGHKLSSGYTSGAQFDSYLRGDNCMLLAHRP